MENEPLAQIREEEKKSFVTYFGIPRALISNIVNQFVGGKVESLMEELCIKFYNSISAYTQSSGQAESSNKTVLRGIKKKLDQSKEVSLGVSHNPKEVYWRDIILYDLWS